MTTRRDRKTNKHTQGFLDDCFQSGAWDGDWYKHHGVMPYGPSVQVAGKRIYLSDAVAVANYRRGWKAVCNEYPF